MSVHPQSPPADSAARRPPLAPILAAAVAAARGGRAPALVALLLVAGAACASRQDPEPIPSQTTTTVEPQLEPPPADLPPPVRRLPPSAPPDTVKVIDPGEDPDRPTTLVEASRLARRQKQRQEPTTAEITDENLHEYADGASLIIASPPSATPPPAAAPVAEGTSAGPRPGTDPAAEETEEVDGPLALGDLAEGGAALGETYWRDRALAMRMGWRRTIDEISELELEAAALRQQFYAEDDLRLRDEQIKPQWDRTLDRLERLRQRALRYEDQLEVLVAEGRENDVPQGWLNEGWELEPSLEELEHVRKIGVHEPVDTEPAAEARDVD